MKRNKKRFIAVITSCMMFLGLGSLVSAAEYPDVNPGDWYYKYVQDVSNKGLMSGYTDTGRFGANDKLTRGQFATILYRMSGEPDTQYNGRFPDVADGIFYSIPISWASNNEIITGYSHNGHFGPNDYINREQMATILYRYSNSPEVDSSVLAQFPDSGRVSEFAQKGMSFATNQKIITGDNGNLNPQGTVVRAVCATMISRFSGNQGGGDTNNGQNPDGQHGSPDTEPEQPTFNIEAWAEKNGFVYDSTAAEYLGTINDVCYSCNNGNEIWVYDGKSATGSVEILESIDGIPVTGIGYGAFLNNANITDITIPATVTKIIPSAFNDVEIQTYTFKGNAPEGFNAINPYNREFTVYYPQNASGWDGYTFVSQYFRPTMVAY